MEEPNRLIMASRVKGTDVYHTDGQRAGYVDDLSIDKQSGAVVYAILALGGFLGLGEEMHPVPWEVLDFDPVRGGYVIHADLDALKSGPTLTREELEDLGAGDTWRERVYDHYARRGPYTA